MAWVFTLAYLIARIDGNIRWFRWLAFGYLITSRMMLVRYLNINYRIKFLKTFLSSYLWYLFFYFDRFTDSLKYRGSFNVLFKITSSINTHLLYNFRFFIFQLLNKSFLIHFIKIFDIQVRNVLFVSLNNLLTMGLFSLKHCCFG